MTGTDLPTVVRNPKIKVKIKSAPQQTTRYARGSLRLENHLRTHLHRHRPGTWHVPKYMGESDILTDPGQFRYDSDVTEDPDQLLTSVEVAAIFRVNERTVRRWAAAGDLDDCAIYTPGGQVRYKASAIRRRANPPQTSGPGHLTPPGTGAGPATNRPEGHP